MADIEPVTPAHATPVIVTLPAEIWYCLACQRGPAHVACRGNGLLLLRAARLRADGV
jgi:hypothetical protein